MEQMLMKVQVGPVQEFIAQARSTRDMWAGSYLLSWLTAAAMKVFKDAECEFIFPTLDQQPLYDLFCGSPPQELNVALIPTLPNVFMLKVDKAEVTRLCKDAKAALKDELKQIADACWVEMKTLGVDEKWKARWDTQIEAFPIFNWQAVPYCESKPWSEQVDRLGRAMAARRNTREFDQWGLIENEQGNLATDRTHFGSSKDVLSGKEELIGDEAFWKKDFWKKAGPFGAMNCIKRLFPDAYLQPKCGVKRDFWNNMSMLNTRSIAAGNSEGTKGVDSNGEAKPKNPYMAVIAMDGDRMGKALLGLKTEADHTAFSETLARFSVQAVPEVINDCEKSDAIQLVYAGGDDVLVMCPADKALELAEALRNKFCGVMKRYIDGAVKGEEMDASCGIAVGHYMFPLQRIVDEARKAEGRAKNERGRAAFALSLLKRSGEIIHWGGKWNMKGLAVYKDFTKKSGGESPEFSGRFPYALAELLAPYRVVEKPVVDLQPIIKQEFLHVQERQAQRKNATVEGALKYLAELQPQQLEDFPNLFLASAFMNRQRGEV